MKLPLLVLAIALMFSGGHSGSQGYSCSMINGKTICQSSSSPDGTAGVASSVSSSGSGGSYQSVATGTGTSGGQFSSDQQTVIDGQPGAIPFFGSGAFAGAGFPFGGVGAFAGAGAGFFPFGR